MNTQLTEIAFVLDRSGSMHAMHEFAVEGFNKFLADQQADEQEVRLSLIFFDHEYATCYQSVPVAKLSPLTINDFEPRGSTALLDAMGKTIDDLGERIANSPENDRPGHVIVAILTDGMENASERYTLSDIHNRITHQQQKYNWDFLFLSSDLRAVDLAIDAGIKKAKTIKFAFSPKGFRNAAVLNCNMVRGMKEERRRRLS